MLAVEELVLSELGGGEEAKEQQGLPPGFRFHPTDEELITFYLASKVFSGSFCGVDIAEVDLNRCEPWELPDVAKMGEREWYFFSVRDRKYPTGVRTNRATGAGYWKATGKDREVYSNSISNSNSNRCIAGAGAGAGALLGMKKTLIFYKGRAPRGEKTKWVMHEYRLDGDFSYRHTCSKEEWVICRIFHKTGEKKNIGVDQGQGQSYMLEVSSMPTSTATTCLPRLLETPTPTPTPAFQGRTPMQSHAHNPTFMKENEQLMKISQILIMNSSSVVNVSQSPPLLLPPSPNGNGLVSDSVQPCFSGMGTGTPPASIPSIVPTTPDQNAAAVTHNPTSSAAVVTNSNVNPAASMLFNFNSLLNSHQDHCILKEQTTTIPKQCKTELANYYFSQYFQLPDDAICTSSAFNFNWMDKIQQQPSHSPPLFLEMDYSDLQGLSQLGTVMAGETACCPYP